MIHKRLSLPPSCFLLQRWTDTTTRSTCTTAGWSFSSARSHQKPRITNRPSSTGNWTRSVTFAAKTLCKHKDLYLSALSSDFSLFNGLPCVSHRCATKNGITTCWMSNSPLCLCLWMEPPLSPSWLQRITRCTPPRSKLSSPSVPAGKVQPLICFLFFFHLSNALKCHYFCVTKCIIIHKWLE